MSRVIWVIFLLSVELLTIVNMAYSVQTGIFKTSMISNQFKRIMVICV